MKDIPQSFYNSGEGEARTLDRPLGHVSNFVVEQLPIALERLRASSFSMSGLELYVESLVSSLSAQTISGVLADSRARDVAGLDLKMLEAAIFHSKGDEKAKPPHRLGELVDEFSAQSNQPPCMTYEEIVLINPTDDIRLFTRDNVGKTEEAFYRAHKKIESHLDTAIDTAREGIQELGSKGNSIADQVAKRLHLVALSLRALVEGTHNVGLQDSQHFLVFRKYFGSNTGRGTKGPSGAFTAGVPTLELLIAGEKLPQEYMHYLDDNNIYFPRQGRRGLAEAREFVRQGMTLTALGESLGNPDDLVDSIQTLSGLIRRFRGEHYLTVRNQVPEAIVDKVAGSGGEAKPGIFLRGRMKIRHIGDQNGE